MKMQSKIVLNTCLVLGLTFLVCVLCIPLFWDERGSGHGVWTVKICDVPDWAEAGLCEVQVGRKQNPPQEFLVRRDKSGCLDVTVELVMSTRHNAFYRSYRPRVEDMMVTLRSPPDATEIQQNSFGLKYINTVADRRVTASLVGWLE